MKIILPFLLILIGSMSACAQQSETDRLANRPVEPFRIVGSVYYVGASDVTSFLITTPEGHFLLDSGYAETVPQIRQNVKKLGFKLEDVKFLLNSQSHFDHSGGLAELKRLTQAVMVASAGDRIGLESGGRNDFHFGDTLAYEPVNVDRVVRDGEEISLGGVSLKAAITPGHTRGCTTWLLTVDEKGRKYNVVFAGSTSVPGYRLLGNEKYPSIVSDYEHTFAVLKKLKTDVFLSSHGSFFDLLAKADKIKTSPDPNPFIDPAGYARFLAESEKIFREKLEKEKPRVASPTEIH